MEVVGLGERQEVDLWDLKHATEQLGEKGRISGGAGGEGGWVTD